MLRVSKMIDYGTLMLAHMAREPERVFSASELAGVLGLGQPVVSKILKLLGQHAILTSSRGVHGGYTLARAAQTINLAQVIDALEDQPFGLTECTAIPGTCQIESACHMRMNWQRINHMVRRTLEAVSIADMRRPTVSGGTCTTSVASAAVLLEFPLHRPPRVGSRPSPRSLRK